MYKIMIQSKPSATGAEPPTRFGCGFAGAAPPPNMLPIISKRGLPCLGLCMPKYISATEVRASSQSSTSFRWTAYLDLSCLNKSALPFCTANSSRLRKFSSGRLGYILESELPLLTSWTLRLLFASTSLPVNSLKDLEASRRLPVRRYGKTARAAYSAAVCESSNVYHSYSNLANTSGESFVPSARCLSASYASCSSAYSDPATWCRSGSPAGYSPYFADHLVAVSSECALYTRACIHYHLGYKLLPRGFFAVELAQECQELALVARVWLELRLFVDLDQEDSKITTAPSLPGLEQRLRDIEQDVRCGTPILLLHIPRGDDSRLLLGFVELSFCNPGTS